jgi:nucleoside-diphosphate-sugar epimerase
VLIVGCGDVGMRAVPLLLRVRLKVLALTSSPERAALLRAAGVVPLVGNLDRPSDLRRLAGWAHRVLHLAPPPTDAGLHTDPRTRHVLHALARGTPPATLVYGSTTGVYGDCQGAWITETRAVAPGTARAQRRVDAERQLRRWARCVPASVSRHPRPQRRVALLRIPGIYAPNREGGTPHARLRRGTPVLRDEDDVYTNHIHADDLARACVHALWRAKAGGRVYHASDDTELKMGDYFDLAADLYGLPRPPRCSRLQAQDTLAPMLLSFMSESRRLHNQRLKTELRLVLHYPTVAQGLRVG